MISLETPVGEIAKTHFQTVKVFDDYQIDFCCGGKESLERVCQEKSLNPGEVISRLEEAIQQPTNAPNFDSMELVDLIQYIINTHHSFVRETIPLLSRMLDKIEEVHGERHPEIIEVNAHFKESAGQLTMHMQKEEIVLFPLIEKLSQLKRETKTITISNNASVNNPINAMMQEHENEGARFEEIARLTQNYTIPQDACNTYRAAYETLHSFEKDLHRHIHLENNILFPKAALLEQEVVKKN
ncbi:iron-sulfur cluster repair di-iron protein [uncultured Sunxiuqinia sp.]|uniref:iron-sulfur cluster repair di-iron protein n=1 Tax=uncultured Sunxiuqinia sp. TaxID=1573825 RepID=UPI002617DFCE|nr:iron-sulfur cluster repair di-iron protein [uncultured Sunxiuqinia sp.]